MVLDRSGSMESCVTEIISGYNAQLETLTNGGGRVWVTCLQFDQHFGVGDAGMGINLDVLYERKRVGEAPRLTTETYVPRGGTPMLDAVGKAIAIGDKETKADAILVMTYSDGQENASRTETWTTIAEKIKARTAKGNWSFGYVGANQDLAVVSQRMNIPIGNTMAYQATPRGSQVMYAASSGATTNFSRAASAATSTLFSEPTAMHEATVCTCSQVPPRLEHEKTCPKWVPGA